MGGAVFLSINVSVHACNFVYMLVKLPICHKTLKQYSGVNTNTNIFNEYIVINKSVTT